MKCKRSIALLALALTLALVPAILAQPNKPLRFEVEVELSWDPFQWDGTIIAGDIVGDFTITPLGAVFPGITEHYIERWDIVTDEGTITVYQEGVWSFKSFKFKSNGYVTAATGEWAYLVGSDMHVRGVTTEFLGPPFPIYGTGTVWICGFGPE